MHLRSRQPAGFTVVEMSVVVVVIGLLLIGVFGGRALYEHAQLQAVIAEMKGYSSVIKNFREKYNALPGDMANAYPLFSPSCDCGTDNTTFASAAGCNGNGNGALRTVEVGLAWRHLWCADMIGEPFPSATAAANYSSKANCGKTTAQACPRGNLPGSRYSGTYGKDKAWLFEHTQELTNLDFGTPTDRVHGYVGNYLILAGHDNTSGSETGGGLLTGDAAAIDTKIDDGLAGAGNMLAVIGYNAPYTMTGTCFSGGAATATGENQPNVAYNTNENTADRCRPMFNPEYF